MAEQPGEIGTAQRIEAFVREMEKAGVSMSGWDDEAVYFNHAKFAVRVSKPYPDKTHTVEAFRSDGRKMTHIGGDTDAG